MTSVINFLQGLINKANNLQGPDAAKEYQYFIFIFTLFRETESIYKMLGYFSIIGLCRIHCLLGDYHLALQTIAPIELTAHKGLSTQVSLFLWLD